MLELSDSQTASCCLTSTADTDRDEPGNESGPQRSSPPCRARTSSSSRTAVIDPIRMRPDRKARTQREHLPS